jgi:methanogenic corrinoid protein MtbC1
MAGALVDAMRRYDEAAVEATLSSAFARFPADVVLVEVITPMLVAVGEQWANGELPSSAEHFASNIIHRRLCALLGEQPAAAAGSRPIVVLGCVAGEHHELGLLMLAVFLRWAGARVVYLGADVPMEDLLQVLRETGAAGLCLSATAPSSTAALHATVSQLRQAGVQAPIFAGGAAAVGAPPVGAHTLSGDLRSVCAAVLATLGS